MKRVQRIAIEAIAAVCREAACSITVERGGKHMAVIVRAPAGGWRKITIAGTPRAGDVEIANWSRQDAARVCRELGVTGGATPTPTLRPRQHHRRNVTEPRRQPRPEPTTDGPGRDPWAALREWSA